jgi:flagellar hook-associated protein 3 FlgL
MTITNVSSYGSLQTLLQHIGRTQGSLADSQIQTSSGKKSQTFEGISSSVERFTSLNSQIDRLGNYKEINTVVVGQLQTTNNSLKQVIDLTTNVKRLIATQVSGTSNDPSFGQQLKAQLESIASVLNVSYSGSYLFGGTNTSTQPVKTPIPASTTTGIADDSYYNGSNDNATARISDSQAITPNIRANEKAFQNIIAGINQALEFANKAGSVRADALKASQNLIDEGIKGTIALQATVNANILIVNDASTQSQTLVTYYKGIISEINDADVVELSTKVSQDTAVLQASYSTFARISKLSLVTYLS